MVAPQHPLAKRVFPPAAPAAAAPVTPATPCLKPAEAPATPSSLDVSRPAPEVAPCPPECYRSTDANVLWVNSRPYKLNRLLGKGGFGEVHEVELLLPYGLEVDWDESGNVRFNEDGYIMLNRSQEENRGRNHVEDAVAASENDQQCPSEAQVKSLPSSVFPFQLSMTPSESMWFSLVGRNGGVSNHGQGGSKRPASPSASAPIPSANHGQGGSKRPASPSAPALAANHGQSGSKRPASPSTPAPGDGPSPSRGTASHNPPCDFPVASDLFLQGSGLFSALKIQSARSQKELDSLVKEVENLRLLSGEPGIVQLREHTINKESLYLIILMELGACDLHEFLKRSQYTLDVPSICSVWQTLVHRVESVHQADMIHRDIKAQNFILVPTKGYCDAKILARVSTRRDDFVFRLVLSDEEELGSPSRNQGDVELVITDPVTGREDVVLLSIKLTDFGIARTLEEDEAHLSLPGPNGTVVFMAPEAVRQTVSGCRKVSKRVDIWALGVMLYQLLHEGQTPFGHYLTKGGPPEVLLAVASETVNRKAMDFDASSLWKAERTRLWSEVVRSSWSGAESAPAQDLPRTTTGEMVQELVVSWVSSEFLVKVCKRCLTFDVNDRIDGADLRVWIDRLRSDRAIEASWTPGGTGGGVSRSELLQAAFNIDANGMMQTVDFEVARIGERIGASLFPEIWMPYQDSTTLPLSSPSSPRQHEGSSPAGSVRINEKEFLDLEVGRRQPPENDTSSKSGSGDHLRRHGRFRQAFALIAVVLLSIGGLSCAIWKIASARSSSPGSEVKDDHTDSSSVPSTAPAVSPVQSPEIGSSSSTTDPGGVKGGNDGAPGETVGPWDGGPAGGGGAAPPHPPSPVTPWPPPRILPPPSPPPSPLPSPTSTGSGDGPAGGPGVDLSAEVDSSAGGFDLLGEVARGSGAAGGGGAAGSVGGVGGGVARRGCRWLEEQILTVFDDLVLGKNSHRLFTDLVQIANRDECERATVIALISDRFTNEVVKDFDDVARVRAIHVLSRFAEEGDEKMIAAISGRLADADSSVRHAAHIVLVEQLPKEHRAKVITAILDQDLLSHKDDYARDMATVALGQLAEKGDAPVIEVISHLLADEHYSIRVEALKLLANNCGEKVTAAMSHCLADDGKSFIDSIYDNIRHPARLRVNAIQVLAELAKGGDEKLISAISDRLADPSPVVRHNAREALRMLADKHLAKVITVVSHRLAEKGFASWLVSHDSKHRHHGFRFRIEVIHALTDFVFWGPTTESRTAAAVVLDCLCRLLSFPEDVSKDLAVALRGLGKVLVLAENGKARAADPGRAREVAEAIEAKWEV